MDISNSSSSTLDKLLSKLDYINEFVVSGNGSEDFMLLALQEVVQEMKKERALLELNVYVVNENPLVFKLLMIVGNYLMGHNDIFKPLSNQNIFKSPEFFISWSNSLRRRGKEVEAVQVIGQGIANDPSQLSVLQPHLNPAQFTNGNPVLSVNNEPRFNELASEIVNIIINSSNLWSCVKYATNVEKMADKETQISLEFNVDEELDLVLARPIVDVAPTLTTTDETTTLHSSTHESDVTWLIQTVLEENSNESLSTHLANMMHEEELNEEFSPELLNVSEEDISSPVASSSNQFSNTEAEVPHKTLNKNSDEELNAEPGTTGEEVSSSDELSCSSTHNESSEISCRVSEELTDQDITTKLSRVYNLRDRNPHGARDDKNQETERAPLASGSEEDDSADSEVESSSSEAIEKSCTKRKSQCRRVMSSKKTKARKITDQVTSSDESEDSQKSSNSHGAVTDRTKKANEVVRQSSSKIRCKLDEVIVLTQLAHGNELELTEGELKEAKHFRVYEPHYSKSKRSYKKRRVRCPGCSKLFGATSNRIYEQKFHTHCVKECDEYKKLGLISHCMECKHSFRNNKIYRRHPCFKEHQSTNPIVPFKSSRSNEAELTHEQLLETDDFDVHVPKTSMTLKSWSATVECPGCRQEFPARQRGLYSPQFYQHCVKECEEYKMLNLISHCLECKLSFYNHTSYCRHNEITHQQKPIVISVRNATQHNFTKKQLNEAKSFNVHIPKSSCLQSSWARTVQCPGCRMEFPARLGAYSPQFHQHCVKECDEYKKLNMITHCFQCKLSFLTRKGKARHDCVTQ